MLRPVLTGCEVMIFTEPSCLNAALITAGIPGAGVECKTAEKMILVSHFFGYRVMFVRLSVATQKART